MPRVVARTVPRLLDRGGKLMPLFKANTNDHCPVCGTYWSLWDDYPYFPDVIECPHCKAECKAEAQEVIMITKIEGD